MTIREVIKKYEKKFDFHKKYNPNNPGGIKAMRVCQEILKDLEQLKDKEDKFIKWLKEQDEKYDTPSYRIVLETRKEIIGIDK